MKSTRAAVLATALALGSQAGAETLDFTSLPAGNLGSTVSVGSVTIDSPGSLNNRSDQFFPSAGGAICAQRGSNDNCKGTMTIKFASKVSRIKMSSAGYQPGDVGSLLLYRRGSLLGSTGVAWNGRIDLSNFKRVTRIKITYDGVEDGLAYGKIEFTPVGTGKQATPWREAAIGEAPGPGGEEAVYFDFFSPSPFAIAETSKIAAAVPSPVPLPAGTWMLAGAGGLLLTLARRRRAA